jgi:hypothetical protein
LAILFVDFLSIYDTPHPPLQPADAYAGADQAAVLA